MASGGRCVPLCDRRPIKGKCAASEPARGSTTTTYKHQNNKYTKTEFEAGTVLQQIFDEFNGPRMLQFLEEVTGVEDLVSDDKLFGGVPGGNSDISAPQTAIRWASSRWRAG